MQASKVLWHFDHFSLPWLVALCTEAVIPFGASKNCLSSMRRSGKAGH